MPGLSQAKRTPKAKGGRGTFVDLTGQKIDGLTVVEKAGKHPANGQILWKVRFDKSGIETTYTGNELRYRTADLREPTERNFNMLPERLKPLVSAYNAKQTLAERAQENTPQPVTPSLPATATNSATGFKTDHLEQIAYAAPTPQADPANEGRTLLHLIEDYLSDLHNAVIEIEHRHEDTDSISAIKTNFPGMREQLKNIQVIAVSAEGMIGKVIDAVNLL